MKEQRGDRKGQNHLPGGEGGGGVFYYTGCFGMTAKKLELITRARKQPITRERGHFVHYIGTFCYLVSMIYNVFCHSFAPPKSSKLDNF